MSSRRPGSARPSTSKRSSVASSKGSQRDQDLEYECKAAYLVMFDSIDDTIDSRRQLSEVMQQTGRNPTKKVLNKYWTQDTDCLTFDEFVDICQKEPATTEDDLMHAFRKIDLNGDGYIDNRELKKVLTTRGERMTTEEVQEIIDEVDENNDGKLDYKEFSKMLLSTQKECKKLALDQLEKKSGHKRDSRDSKRRLDDDDSDATLEGDVHQNGKLDSELPDQSMSSDSRPLRREVIGHDALDVAGPSESKQSCSDGDTSDDGIVYGKPTSARSNISSSGRKENHLGSRTSLHSTKSNNMSRPSPRAKERTKSPIAGKDLKLAKPKRIKDWKLSHSKGCFFFDDDNKIISHQYEMVLTKETSVWITIEPFSIRPGGDLNSAREVSRSPIDTMLCILRNDNSLVTMTEQRDAKGRYGIRCDLERGRYKLIPFTTGCRFRPRISEPSSETKLVKKSGDQFPLTKQFKDAINDIFELCDLDGNGSLSRQEFNFYNLRTSGEEVNDSEWEVVEERLELKDGEITRQAFVQLTQMEADDNAGDTDELWVTLESMGFSRNLTLDESCPFFMGIYTEIGEAKLRVTELKTGGMALEEALVDATIGKGEAGKIRNMKDLFLHTYMNDYRASLVVENKSHHSVKVNIDSSKSENCTPNTPQLDHTISVPARTSMIAQHVMPTKETREWTLRCQENIIK